MQNTNKTTLAVAFSIVVALLLMFAGGAMLGASLTGGMTGGSTMEGITWMWIPTLLMLGLGALLVWVVFEHKE